MLSFRTLAGQGEAAMRVQASRFHALAGPVDDDAAARMLVSGRQRAFWHASHHCSAWVLRDGTRRCDDAGEPAGSAGAPILAAIEGARVVDCCVVVTRWFGGTKLGVGRLVRAYGGVAALALAAAPGRMGTLALRVRIRFGYSQMGAVMRVLGRAGASGIEHGFVPGGGNAALECSIPVGNEPLPRDAVRDQTAGAAELELLGSAVIYALDAPETQS